MSYKVRFPSGKTASELLYYMGIDSINERSEVAQRLVSKCKVGKVCVLEQDELEQLIKDVDNAVDIKADHVYNDGSGWNALQQYNLAKYLSKLQSLIK